jgi:hypothetical protein
MVSARIRGTHRVQEGPNMGNASSRLGAGLLILAGVFASAPARQVFAQSSQPRLVVFEGFYRPT